MDINQFSQSKVFRNVVCAFGVLLILVIVFRAGVFVGYEQGEYSHRAFSERDHRQAMRFSDELPQTHGGVGKITSIKLPSLTVATSDGSEKIVILTASTTIRSSRNDIAAVDLKKGDLIVVLGLPDQAGVIEARLVRVLPPFGQGRGVGASSKPLLP